jgi:hypothetical protein
MYEFRSSNRFVPVRAVEVYGGVEVRLHSFLTSALDAVSVQLYSQEDPPPPARFPQPILDTAVQVPSYVSDFYSPHIIR